jgi:2-octaprenyl-6-methoxyphenol hydroxylase
VIEAWNGGGDPGAPAVLARYQARRRPDTLLMLSGCTRWSGCSGTTCRRCGWRGGSASPRWTDSGLKRAFARQAMGLGPGRHGLLAGRGCTGRA